MFSYLWKIDFTCIVSNPYAVMGWDFNDCYQFVKLSYKIFLMMHNHVATPSMEMPQEWYGTHCKVTAMVAKWPYVSVAIAEQVIKKGTMCRA